MPATFGDVYGRLCERWTDPRERGRQFEPLVERVLRTDRIFRERYAAVWRWSEWPGRHSGDIGVDIVAQRPDGGLTAIQVQVLRPRLDPLRAKPRDLPRVHERRLRRAPDHQHHAQLEPQPAGAHLQPAAAGAAPRPVRPRGDDDRLGCLP